LSIVDLLALLKRKLPFIVVVVTLFIIVGSLVSVFFITPVYQAEVRLIIRNNVEDDKIQSSYYDNLVTQQVTKTYCSIIGDTSVLKQVADAHGKGLKPSAISQMISVENIRETSIIKITVKSNDPVLAAEIANIFPGVVRSELQRLMKVQSVEPIGLATIPKAPVEPNVNRNIIISALAGLIIAVAIVVIMEFFDTTVKTEEDVREKLGMNVIAMLPVHRQVKRKGGVGNEKK
jgi:capsular polysaccharide biosynthesis protein